MHLNITPSRGNDQSALHDKYGTKPMYKLTVSISKQIGLKLLFEDLDGVDSNFESRVTEFYKDGATTQNALGRARNIMGKKYGNPSIQGLLVSAMTPLSVPPCNRTSVRSTTGKPM